MAPKTLPIALLVVTSLNFTYLQAQDGPCTRRTVAVGVVDDQWNLVRGLSTANFRGKLHGHDVEILSASIDTSPRHIALLLDASGSMTEEKEKWKIAKSLSEDLIRSAPPRASIAQMAFTETVLDSAGFDRDRLALLKRLAALVRVCEQPRKSRKTALYDAIASARDTFGELGFGDVIYVVTDAMDNKSRTQPKTAEEDLLRMGVRLFSAVMNLGLGRRVVTPDANGPDQLHSVVKATGGNALIFPADTTLDWIPLGYIRARTSADAVDVALSRLYEQMGEFYRLDLKLPETVDRRTKWKLEVIDANGKSMGSVEIHYPQELMPCANVGG